MQLAVFDLDGTITRHDSLTPYVLGFLKRRPWRLFRLAMVLPTLLRFALGAADRGELKGSLIHWTLGGSSRQEIDAWTARFVPHLIAHGLFHDALEHIARHRSNGDVLVLMSASPEFYVPAIARELGFSEVTCTGVRWVGERLDGRLTTPNCRGEEKVRRFQALQASHAGLPTTAYGNADSDLAHLKLASRGVLVNGDEPTRRRAVREGVVCESWH